MNLYDKDEIPPVKIMEDAKGYQLKITLFFSQPFKISSHHIRFWLKLTLEKILP